MLHAFSLGASIGVHCPELQILVHIFHKAKADNVRFD